MYIYIGYSNCRYCMSAKKRLPPALSHQSFAFAVTELLLIVLVIIFSSPSSTTIPSLGAKQLPLYEISTRNHFNLLTGQLQVLSQDSYDKIQNGIGYRGYPLSNIEHLYQKCSTGIDRPSEVAIVVHGYGVTEEGAKERFDRARLSLEHNNYSIPIIGFSWDSNTAPFTGWYPAELIGYNNGPKLGHFIMDFNIHCPNTAIKIIGHSLGGRVILGTLDYLDQNKHNKNVKIKDVHLLGAAVDNQEVSKNSNCGKFTGFPFVFPGIFPTQSIRCSGNAIQDIVQTKGFGGGFYDLFSSQDRILLTDYKSFDFVPALGQVGASTVSQVDRPSNYHQKDVKEQIPALTDADGDKDCDPMMCSSSDHNEVPNVVNGTNHFGYFGFRSPNGSLIDDGVMDVVVHDWINK
jgi:hypothetical protein